MEKIRWGILSTGRIAEALASAIAHLDDCEVVAVGSRSQESADKFGDKFNIKNRHASYEALCNDPEVDVIYVATPHSHHYDNMLLALNANKHVLCEKAFTINAAQAEQCIDLAREKNLFLMEAMWTRFIPATIQARQWIGEGMIGEIKQVFADLSVKFPYNPEGRIFNPELGGGALLDVGIYPISFAHMLLGTPDDVWSVAFLGETGIDEHDSIMFAYENGSTAQLSTSALVRGTHEATIVGDKGYIRFHAPLHHTKKLTLKLADLPEREIDVPYEGNGYQYEVIEVNQCIRAGKTESSVMTLDDTLAIMKLMDSMREEWGLEYPME
jgi:predicted dehydrogenase